MPKTINAKELRSSLPEVVKRVSQGESFTVFYRSRPAFRIVPLTGMETRESTPLTEEPLYRAEAVGAASDRIASEAHDDLLYR